VTVPFSGHLRTSIETTAAGAGSISKRARMNDAQPKQSEAVIRLRWAIASGKRYCSAMDLEPMTALVYVTDLEVVLDAVDRATLSKPTHEH
jgi:hypothetical protein